MSKADIYAAKHVASALGISVEAALKATGKSSTPEARWYHTKPMPSGENALRVAHLDESIGREQESQPYGGRERAAIRASQIMNDDFSAAPGVEAAVASAPPELGRPEPEIVPWESEAEKWRKDLCSRVGGE